MPRNPDAQIARQDSEILSSDDRQAGPRRVAKMLSDVNISLTQRDAVFILAD